MKVREICSHRVVSVPSHASLGDAARIMKDHQVGALLVTRDGLGLPPRSAGIVTDRDLVLYGIARGDIERLSIEQVMTPDTQSVAANADMHEAIERMRMGGIRRLAVTDDAGDIIGVVSLDDVLQALAADLVGVAGLLLLEHDRGAPSTRT